jgi:hypothetical protein
MISALNQASMHANIRSPREEEQFLCNEALRTGAYDTLSDNEWVALCERTAIGRRDALGEAGHGGKMPPHKPDSQA